MPSSFDSLPSFKATAKLGGKPGTKNEFHAALFDVQFYPFAPGSKDPVFAVTGGVDTVVCRAVAGSNDGIEVLRWLRDEDKAASLNSLAWARDESTGDPLLCVTGDLPTIKVFNITTGTLVQTLAGHGASINDLKVPKTSPMLLASASEDHTIRLWSLDPAHAKQPFAALFAGGGHRAPLHSVDFHASGKYLLSGGMDTCINLWAVPALPNARTGTNKPNEIHYPHFMSAEIHSDKVDCVKFYGDLIISKCAQECRIVLWRIKGFDSRAPVPDPKTSLPPQQTSSADTSSAFGSGWELLLTFAVPDCIGLWLRFDLFHAPAKPPVLAIGNQKGRILFWDLQKLEEGIVGSDDVFSESNRSHKKKKKKKSTSAVEAVRQQRDESLLSSSRAGSGSVVPADSEVGGEDLGKNRNTSARTVGGPFEEQPPHKIVNHPSPKFVGLQTGWSTCDDEAADFDRLEARALDTDCKLPEDMAIVEDVVIDTNGIIEQGFEERLRTAFQESQDDYWRLGEP